MGPPELLAGNSAVVGAVRVQFLAPSLVRLEARGAAGFEDRPTFHISERNWPGTGFTSNLVAGEIVLSTAQYSVHLPPAATSLAGTYVTTPSGRVLYKFDGILTNSVWLPGPTQSPAVLAFADTPRLVPPPWQLTPAPAGASLPATSGWDTNNDAPDIYVFVPGGSYQQLRHDFLKLTGPTEMVPLYALGAFDSRWYDYSEATALQQIDDYRAHQIPLDVLVCDTGWRQNASTGYLPNSSLFPNLPRFFAAAHDKHVRVMFNDHPEPVADTALDPAEVTYRYTNLAQLLGQGLDIWWYDRNWGVALKSPAPNLRKEVWGMQILHDTAVATNAPLRPLIMANIDGIDNGIRNRPMDVAAHRYSIQWSGDISPANAYLKYAVENAVHAGVQSLFPYASDDLGGHTSDPSPSDFIRWIEYGALSPIYRPHCTHNLSRMPWSFGPTAEWIARRYVNMRYRLLPVFYAAARENYDTGEPILRRLDLDYPQYPEAARDNQYLIGHSILVAPVTDNGLAPVPSAWLTTSSGQPGLDSTYFANTNLTGTPALARVDAAINFNWGTGSPGGTTGKDLFTARWTGNITVPASVGDVTLATMADDGTRVWIDGQLCLDNWGPNDSAVTETTLTLKAGQAHQLRVEYLELTGNAIVSLKWRGASAPRSLWIPPGNWINAWSGAVVKGPATMVENVPLDRIPLYLRSGAVLPLAPEMQYTGQLPWNPITLDTYPSTTEASQSVLYEDDTLTTAYKAGQCRKTAIKTWADEATKTVALSIGAAVGSYPAALTQRSWVARLRRPPNWPANLTIASATLNGLPIGPIVRKIKNASAMPLGAENGAPDADVFEITIPASSVLTSNYLVASFAPADGSWKCSDIGAVGAQGNALEGASAFTNSIFLMRGGGAGIAGTNDGFHFLYQPGLGNVQMGVQLQAQSAANTSAEAGLMIRESLSPTARQVRLTATPDGRLLFQARAGATVGEPVTAASPSAACWLRLVRSGDTFTGYTSANNAAWTQIGSATIPGFNAQSYIGLAVTATLTNSSTPANSSFGTPLLGTTAEMSGGLNNVDDARSHTSVFSHPTLNQTASISAVPDQITGPSAPTAAIPFTVSSTSQNPLVISASVTDSNLLTVQNIVFTGTGNSRQVTLTPRPGRSGTVSVTLTANDGISSASSQFSLTVLPLTGILLHDEFINYQTGNLPGQNLQGTGFAANGSWLGLDLAFVYGVPDAGVFSFPGLVTASLSSTGGKVTVKGDGSDLIGLPDLSTNGPFAAAGLLDAANATIGGNVTGTLYLSFLLRSHFKNGGSAYGGLHLSRGTDTTGVLIGNSWSASAFSLYYAPTDDSFDLRNNNGSGEYLLVDTNTHLLVVRINYQPGANTLTAWLDPDTTQAENSQNSSTTYLGTLSGDLSFNRLILRGGNAGKQFDYSSIRIGTDWLSVLPTARTAIADVISVLEATLAPDKSFDLAFSGPAAQPYTVWATTNLALPSADWQNIGSGTFGFDPANFCDISAQNLQARFYRVTSP